MSHRFKTARPALEILEDRVLLDHKGFPHGGGGSGGGGGGGGEDPSTTYVIVDLGDTVVRDINNVGQIVGGNFLFEDLNNNRQVDSGEMVDLGTFGASAINDRGWVVGANGNAILWRDLNNNRMPNENELIDLGNLGGDWSTPTGINESGQIVGYGKTSFGEFRPFLINPIDTNGDNTPDTWFQDVDGQPGNDLLVNLGTLPYDPNVSLNGYSIATSLNDNGWVVGRSRALDAQANGNFDHAFVIIPEDTNGDGAGDTWYRDQDNDGFNDLMIDLGTQGRLYSYAEAINENGLVAGHSANPTFDSHPIHWQVNANRSFAVTEFGIPKKFEGAWFWDVNDLTQPQSVGYVSKKQSANVSNLSDRAPVLWQNGKAIEFESIVTEMGGFSDLDRLVGINNSGVIIGLDDTYDGLLVSYRSFVAFPTTANALSAVSTGNSTTETLAYSQIEPIVNEAIHRWESIDANTPSLADVRIVIKDLTGTTLGLASGKSIFLDTNAAGWGWFIDPTPWDDSEFTTPGNQGEQDRMDLLTVIMHEMGHLLSYEHEEEGVMQETLAAGERHTMVFDSSGEWEQALFALAMSTQQAGDNCAAFVG